MSVGRKRFACSSLDGLKTRFLNLCGTSTCACSAPARRMPGLRPLSSRKIWKTKSLTHIQESAQISVVMILCRSMSAGWTAAVSSWACRTMGSQMWHTVHLRWDSLPKLSDLFLELACWGRGRSCGSRWAVPEARTCWPPAWEQSGQVA